MDAQTIIPRDQANRVIGALRKGVPSTERVDLYSVGREQLLAYFGKRFREVREFGDSDIKFISADWGHGKSHFLDLLMSLALDQKFVVSKVELHSREAPFDQLQLVVQRIMASIVLPPHRRNGLEALLSEWSESTRSHPEQQIYSSLRDALVTPEMRLHLMEYRRHHCAAGGPDYQQCLLSMKWFEGKESKTKTFSDPRQYIQSFVNFVRSLGYSGFIVMLDEAEAITSLSRVNRRDLANENIRQLIDNAQDTQGFYFVFSSTPTFLSGESERGAKDYDALWRRINDPLQGIRQDSLQKVIVELHRLSEDEFFRLAQNIKAVYEIAVDRKLDSVNEQALRTLAHYAQTQTDKRVGTMVRSTVALLDESAQPGFQFERQYEIIVERVRRQEEIDRAE